MNAIGIVGLACCYADARSPAELWENVLAQRRAFRRIPAQRLRLADYLQADPAAADGLYATEAAVLADYQFDRVEFRVAGSTYRSADLAHWLALDVGAQALADAGFAQGDGLPRESTGVLVGNTLTGEISRANTLRLRWPYVQRVTAAALDQAGLGGTERSAILLDLEARYKQAFPAMTEESLAGGLSNTIAGRICNHFDLGGGGYTVDGACASSLLAVAQACTALAAGDLDVAIAGGVDISLDPFELVGFARTGALAPGEMRVFDARSAGFIPGEGCGMVVLMRLDQAVAQGRRVYAAIRGWGVSSDGSGGISRPEMAGQLLAIRRAYARAGFAPGSVAYFEGHGTGTRVGDATEIRALLAALGGGAAAVGDQGAAVDADAVAGRGGAGARAGGGAAAAGAEPAAPAAVLGSIKALIGHTKAAAGVAGLIKASLAIHHQVLPPTAGCDEPHPDLLRGDAPRLRVLDRPEPWPADLPLRAGVSAMGFGGINSHLVVEGVAGSRRGFLSPAVTRLATSAQDAELLLLAGADRADLARQVETLLAVAPRLAYAELGDLAVDLASRAHDGLPVRAAVVAARPAELAAQLGVLRDWLAADEQAAAPPRLALRPGLALGAGSRPGRVGLLFPGQGVAAHAGGGALGRRFPAIGQLYARLEPRAPAGDGVDTAVAQPLLVVHSAAALLALDLLGIRAVAAVGHSLGELAALFWAGALDEAQLVRIAGERGRAMADLGAAGGAMATLGAPPERVDDLLPAAAVAAGQIAVAAYNGPRRTVVSGAADAVEATMARARAAGIAASRLRVSHAFHSPLVAGAAPRLAAILERAGLRPPARRIASTVTGGWLDPQTDLARHLLHQLTAPVRFTAAMAVAAGQVDLWIEAGAGSAMADVAAEVGAAPVVSLDAGGPSLRGLLSAAGAAFCAGVTIDRGALFGERFARPFDVDHVPAFIANPCEQAPLPDTPAVGEVVAAAVGAVGAMSAPAPASATDGGESAGLAATGALVPGSAGAAVTSGSPAAVGVVDAQAAIAVVRRLVAARAELPPEAVAEHSRLLGDLHLNSISVGQLAVDAARQLGLEPPASPADFATATVGQMADALVELARHPATAGGAGAAPHPPGIATWVRAFTVELVERPLAPPPPAAAGPRGNGRAAWTLLAPPDHPLAARLQSELDAAGGSGGGVVLCLPAAPDERQVGLLLAAAAAVLATPASPASPVAAVVVQQDGGGGAFARSLYLERAHRDTAVTCVVDVPFDHTAAARWVAAEVAAAPAGWSEARYDARGTRRVPVLRLLPLPAAGAGESLATPVAGAIGSGAPGATLAPAAAVVPGAAAVAPRGAAVAPAAAVAPGAAAVAPPAPAAADAALELGPRDVLLVSGGGKGIAAECALALARASGARLALLGRSRPEDDGELAANLERMRAAGVAALYVAVDVSDAAAVGRAVERCRAQLGPVTALLHGAGHNQPRPLADLDAGAFLRTLGAKLIGARNLLAALAADPLRLFVAFGSVIARTGMHGEADYAVANEWLRQLGERLARERPGCRCLTVEWSVWAGVGMGERLGSLEALLRQGITPIAVDSGVAALSALLAGALPATATSAVVSGRLGEPPTVEIERRPLPLLRFLERPRVYYPGVELVVDTALSADSDPYVSDHVFRGDPLFPAVMGLEAMAQAAMAVAGSQDPPSFQDVELLRPVVVGAAQPVVIRLAALARAAGRVDLALRCSATGFQVDHFRAVCLFAQRPGAATAGLDLDLAAAGVDRSLAAAAGGQDIPGAATALYDQLLFHQGRFRRVQGYRRLRARECLATISPDGAVAWFSRYLPPELLLGDAALRDAAIHALQACVPHMSVLPAGVERVTVARLDASRPHQVWARERCREGDTFTYDVRILDDAGRTCEEWTGLRLRGVQPLPPPAEWPLAMVGPYVERRLQELLPDAAIAVQLEPLAAPRGAASSELAVARLLGPDVELRRRPDGKPEVTLAGSSIPLSAAYAGDVMMVVAGRDGVVGCDLEVLAPREPRVWADLLGGERWILAQILAADAAGGDLADPNDLNGAATRVWVAAECLRKAGAPHAAPLVVDRAADGAWQILRSGDFTIATLVVPVRELRGRLAIAVLTAAPPPAPAGHGEPAPGAAAAAAVAVAPSMQAAISEVAP